MSVKECENKFCKEYIKKIIDLEMKIGKKLSNNSKLSMEDKKKAEKKYLEKIEKHKKDILNKCKLGFCNPTCKGTIFQNGENFPKETKNQLKKNLPNKKMSEKIIKIMIEYRKTLFKDEKSIIKNGFYKKLKKNNIKKLKKNGALSGCSLIVF